jgi:hypothetical protein
MATWTIHSDLKVTYVGRDGTLQDCGTAEASVLRPEVEAWVITSAAVGDVIEMGGRAFVRQAAEGAQ